MPHDGDPLIEAYSLYLSTAAARRNAGGEPPKFMGGTLRALAGSQQP